MTDTQILEKLQNEISELKEILDEKHPHWFDDTIQKFVDEKGDLAISVCVPIRAAINLLRQNKG